MKPQLAWKLFLFEHTKFTSIDQRNFYDLFAHLQYRTFIKVGEFGFYTHMRAFPTAHIPVKFICKKKLF